MRSKHRYVASIVVVIASSSASGGCVDTEIDAWRPSAVETGLRYRVESVASGKCLDVAASPSGGDVHIRACNGSARQAWRIESAGGDFVRLHNEDTERCMGVAGGSTSKGARVVDGSCAPTTSQQLAVSSSGGGTYELTARHSGLALDVKGAKTADGTPLIQWSRTGAPNQRFRLVPLDEADDPAACEGAGSVTPDPFGCELAWGANGNSSNRSSYLDFITTWVGYEPNGGLDGRCDGCNLVRALASTGATPTYYAYFIGFQASAAGYGDCNTDSDGQNLCNRGAEWLRNNRDRVVAMYGNYARMTRDADPDARVVWLLDGDFIQYTYPEQSAPFSMQELGELTREIVCAIKSSQPEAIVALNHSSWVRNPTLTSYFEAMPLEVVDLIWTTGMGNADGYLNTGDAYGRIDGTYAYLRDLTGKKLLVDTSFGASQQSDSWTNIGAATLNQRISDGVIAVNVTAPPSDYQARITALAPSLVSTCPARSSVPGAPRRRRACPRGRCRTRWRWCRARRRSA
jgi:hypothetical protein